MKIRNTAMEVILQVAGEGEGSAMVETGHWVWMIASNVVEQVTGPEIVHWQVVVLDHSHLRVVGIVGLVVVGIAMQLIVTDTWTIDMTEVVMVIAIGMKVDMGAVIGMLTTGTFRYYLFHRHLLSALPHLPRRNRYFAEII